MTGTGNAPQQLLSPLQRRTLRRLFADYRELQAFFLTGGTALACFYFGHRRSDDLDLFTVAPEALLTIPSVMADLGEREGLTVERSRDFTFMQQFLVSDPGDPGTPALRVEFVKDIQTQFGELRNFAGVLVDDPRNIASNKICAVLGRTEPKDFVDLYVLLQQGYDFDELFAEARQKDGGLTPFLFAACLRQVTSFSRLPNMVWSLRVEDVRASLLSLADRLLERLNPLQEQR